MISDIETEESVAGAFEYIVRVNGESHRVTVEAISPERIDMQIGGQRYSVDVTPALPRAQRAVASVEGASRAAGPLVGSSVVAASERTSGAANRTGSASASSPKAVPTAKAGTGVAAPMPGIVVSVPVQVGQSVGPGDVVAVVEAMKMENNLYAGSAAVISEVHVVPGAEVNMGQILVSFQVA